MNSIQWPQGKRFAFTVFDDTDLSRTGNYEIVYDLLRDLGFRTTKSVWPLKHSTPGYIGGATLEDGGEYLRYHKDLQADGFEIGYHCSSYSSHDRANILRGLDLFRQEFGHDPVTMSNHANSKEALYWGPKRLDSFGHRLVYQLATKFRQDSSFCGEDEDSGHYWGDFCCQRIKYVRNFITSDINTLKVFPLMPYHDSRKPCVPYWYASSEGPEVHSFNCTINEKAQDQLESEGGACIMYAHFACGFQHGGKLNPRFSSLMKRLADKGGWYVPVGTLLDYLLLHRPNRAITPGERRYMERQWFWHKFKVGGTS
jgi:hypothetical protein